MTKQNKNKRPFISALAGLVALTGATQAVAQRIDGHDTPNTNASVGINSNTIIDNGNTNTSFGINSNTVVNKSSDLTEKAAALQLDKIMTQEPQPTTFIEKEIRINLAYTALVALRLAQIDADAKTTRGMDAQQAGDYIARRHIATGTDVEAALATQYGKSHDSQLLKTLAVHFYYATEAATTELKSSKTAIFYSNETDKVTVDAKANRIILPESALKDAEQRGLASLILADIGADLVLNRGLTDASYDMDLSQLDLMKSMKVLAAPGTNVRLMAKPQKAAPPKAKTTAAPIFK